MKKRLNGLCSWILAGMLMLSTVSYSVSTVYALDTEGDTSAEQTDDTQEEEIPAEDDSVEITSEEEISAESGSESTPAQQDDTQAEETPTENDSEEISAESGSESTPAQQDDTQVEETPAENDSEETATENVSESTPAQQDAASTVVQEEPLMVPYALTDIEFTKVEIHEGSPTGTLIADLLSNTAPSLSVGTEYYLVIAFAKGDADSWVSIDLPWWTTPGNMVGGSNWKTAGASVTHTCIDKVVDYTAATGFSDAAATDAGKVTYHVLQDLSGVTNPQLEISFKVNSAYFSGNAEGQVVAAAASQLSVACGAMNGDAAGAASASVSTTSITKTGSAGFYVSTGDTGYGVPNASSTATVEIAPNGNVWTDISFDVVYDSTATISASDIVYGSETTTCGDEAVVDATHKKRSCTVANTAGAIGGGPVKVTASYPAMGTFTAEVTMTSNTWKDENGYLRKGTGTLKWLYATNPDISVNGGNFSRYDWLGQENVSQNTLLSIIDLANTGIPDDNSKTISIAYPSNAIIRAITVPLYEDHGTAITLNGTSYDLTAATTVVEPSASNGNVGYALFTNTDIGLTTEQSIASAIFEVGKIASGTHTKVGLYSGGDYSEMVSDNKCGAWGSFTNGQDAKTSISLKNTDGTGDPLTASSTASPTDVKIIQMHDVNNWGPATLSQSSIMAGESLTISDEWSVAPYIGYLYGSLTTSYDKDPYVYAIIPEGFKLNSMKLNGAEIEGTDVTAEAVDVPDGTTIYRFKFPTTQEVGFYSNEQITKYFNFELDIQTSTSMNAGTYAVADFIQVGTGESSVYGIYSGARGSTTKPNTYGLNGVDGNGDPIAANTLAAPGGTFNVQPFKGLLITNSMKITENGDPLDTWITYDPADLTTQAVVADGYAAQYKINVKNVTGEDAANADIFFPVPKTGKDYGEVYNPEGAFEFDMTIVPTTIPDGWTVEYIKFTKLVSYSYSDAPRDRLPSTADYTVVTDPNDADMIHLVKTSAYGAGEGAEFIFNISSSDLTGADQAVNTWNCVAGYEIGGTYFVPQTLFSESVKVDNTFIKRKITFKDCSGTETIASGSVGETVKAPWGTDYTIGNEDSTVEQTNCDVPNPGTDSFLVTFLDCNGNTVKIEWVKYGENATAPTGFGTYDGIWNITANVDLRPTTCGVSSKWAVPNTGVK